MNSFSHDRIVFWLGVIGLVLYAAGPAFGLDIRQPELLPVYTLMMGLGSLLKRDEQKRTTSTNGKTTTSSSTE